MSVNIKVKNKMVNDTFYTLAPVNWVLRIFRLSTVKRQQNDLVQCWSLTANIIAFSIMSTINVFCLVFKVQIFDDHGKNNPVKFTDTLQLTYLFSYTEYIVDLIYVYKTRNTYLKYIQFYSSIDKILGPPNFKPIRSKNLTTMIFLIISFMISSAADYTTWLMAFGWVPPTLYSLDYVYLFINALTVLDVVSNVIQIEYRLKVMLRLIENCYLSSLTLSGVEEDEVFEPMNDKLRVNRLKTVTYDKHFGLTLLSKCYVLLNEQVSYINYAYGIRVGAFCLNLLITLIHLTNIIIRIALRLFITTYPAVYTPAGSTTLRIINYAAILHILVYRCEGTYQQCSSIVRLIDLTVVNKKIPSDLKTSLMELRNLILSRPIQFHGANFFTLSYPLLVSVTSVIVTYTIILLQSVQ